MSVMSKRALFGGLVFDETGQALEETHVGEEAHYVIDDGGFRRHVAAEHIDRQVLHTLRRQIMEHKELVSDSTLQLLGKDDLFTKAMIDSSIKNIGDHMNRLIEHGLPSGAQQWLSMLGFRIVVDHHGDVSRLEQPSSPIDEQDL